VNRMDVLRYELQLVLDARARCRPGNSEGIDPEVFHPVGSVGPAYRRQVAEAQEICAGCPVAEECLQLALVYDQTKHRGRPVQGIWGGTTEAERRRLHEARAVEATAEHEGAPEAV
jgi:WhiB family redox-sensing transcriptional regulator